MSLGACVKTSNSIPRMVAFETAKGEFWHVISARASSLVRGVWGTEFIACSVERVHAVCRTTEESCLLIFVVRGGYFL